MTESERLFFDGHLCGPHCDGRILHAPGECEVCDKFPLLQKVRKAWGINSTGQSDPERQPCPADATRGDTHQKWPGNRAVHDSPGDTGVRPLVEIGEPQFETREDGENLVVKVTVPVKRLR